MDLVAIQNLAMKMLRQMVEEKIEDCRKEITNQQRAIQRHKATLKLTDAFAKELAKPPKPFKYPKLTKAQQKANRAALRPAIGVPVPTVAMPPVQ